MEFLKKIIEYRKYKNLYNYESIECLLSIVVSIMFLVLFKMISIYDNYFIFQDFLESFLFTSIFTFIGLIGFLLSALAITLGLLDKKVLEEFENLNKKLYSKSKNNNEYESLENIIFDFMFLGFIISITIVAFVVFIFLIKSNLQLVNKFVFNILNLISTYLFFYIIFGSISLLYECFTLFKIIKNIERILEKKQIIKKNLEKIENHYYGEYCNDSIIANKKRYSLVYSGKIDIYLFGLIDYINRHVSNEIIKERYFDLVKENYFIENDDFNEALKILEDEKKKS